MDAVRLIRRELDGRVPLIGFSGSPWTLATYMVEGASSKEFATIKAMLYDRPELLHRLLDTVACAVTAYLNAQIAAGAQAVMLFDTWGGALGPREYQEFSLTYMTRIIAQLTREHDGRRVPVILFTKGGVNGWRRWRIPAPTPSAWTGPPTSAPRVHASATGSHCRAIWIRPCCMRNPSISAPKSRVSWPPMAMAAGMCSISVTEFIPRSSPPRGRHGRRGARTQPRLPPAHLSIAAAFSNTLNLRGSPD
jgi:hypothetical protein